ncbi:hypothetical protein RA2_04012 [Roseovarius sp. A-2]|uniref:hypothetical protein n=1 Tax=Roseovarius sp. A-2 TaxID=1570360 RepID=UPI0009B51040|nr:hypothetical protein [Roseovarius sp. A-2]GAW36937.1 hypothetical protein RA2_04012 [Roseovarius sp. A-2]
MTNRRNTIEHLPYINYGEEELRQNKYLAHKVVYKIEQEELSRRLYAMFADYLAAVDIISLLERLEKRDGTPIDSWRCVDDIVVNHEPAEPCPRGLMIVQEAISGRPYRHLLDE